MQTDPDKLTKKHQKLTHSDNMKVISHNQREKGEWFINSVMIEGCDVPFKFNRKQKYKTLGKGQRVNMTYYPVIESVAGLEFEYMKVVRIKIS
ncbi:hypothetical protein FLL45_09405 [Aliikangiella marina]|uniref:Uncharacterized protein n=1 Tax=Aliikangiella marina TaxID=1712262 RepID=A0A545TD43_9GAMM|nr:hypothetical protein [Aliikangiella marina]TQV75144.1 hypothetical protein FLL45_09405 [Aliikangiella marina]